MSRRIIFSRAAKDLVQVEHLGGDDLLAGERQQVARQRRRRLGRVGHVEQLRPARVVRASGRQAELQTAGDDREEVVEVVRDAARQPADRLHLLRLDQLAFQPLSIGDVREGHQHLGQRAVRVADGLRRDAEIKARPVHAGRRASRPSGCGSSRYLRQRDGGLVGRLPELEQRPAQELFPIRIAPQSLHGGVGEGQRAVRIGDGDGLRAGAEDGVEDA